MVLNSVGNKFFVFSKVRLTSAILLADLVLLPLKTKESKFSLLKAEIFCSPITHLMLSMILLFPQPFGPIMPVIPSSKLTIVLSAKLLNPLISNDFSLTCYLLFYAANIRKRAKKSRPKYCFVYN